MNFGMNKMGVDGYWTVVEILINKKVIYHGSKVGI